MNRRLGGSGCVTTPPSASETIEDVTDTLSVALEIDELIRRLMTIEEIDEPVEPFDFGEIPSESHLPLAEVTLIDDLVGQDDRMGVAWVVLDHVKEFADRIGGAL